MQRKEFSRVRSFAVRRAGDVKGKILGGVAEARGNPCFCALASRFVSGGKKEKSPYGKLSRNSCPRHIWRWTRSSLRYVPDSCGARPELNHIKNCTRVHFSTDDGTGITSRRRRPICCVIKNERELAENRTLAKASITTNLRVFNGVVFNKSSLCGCG